ncbi:resolvase [Clostridia bacterium]|nr:resolvase [Clostridia bacterium]
MENYKVGVYLRLSQEDETNTQSNSITNQKNLVYDYIIAHGWIVTETYIDDGYSGTNYNRPAFQKLISDIEAGSINLVITKDMSRLGRDYIDTGYYLERYFPTKGIRYIAITDGVDTFDKHSANNDITPFKALINDMYAKDISKKIRAVMDNKRQNGKFIGAFAIYGYSKDISDKNKLVIDQEAAETVKRIYDMYLNGISMSHITRILNDEKVLSPSEYKKARCNYVNVNSKFGIWTQQTIKEILSNPTYRGNMTQGRSTKINYKTSKFRKIKRGDWIVVENTHEPIIEGNSFEVVQTMLSKYASIDYGSGKAHHLFSGMLYCGDCGMPMTFRRGQGKQKNNFIITCSNNARNAKCTRHQIYEEFLDKTVIDDLKSISRKLINSKAFAMQFETMLPKGKLPQNPVEKEVSRIDKRIEEIRNIVKNLYNDKISGLISEDDFVDILKSFNDEKENLLSRRESLSAKQEELRQQIDYMRLIQDVVTFETPHKAILAQLIDKIEIFEVVTINGNKRHMEKQIKAHYNFPAPHEF